MNTDISTTYVLESAMKNIPVNENMDIAKVDTTANMDRRPHPCAISSVYFLNMRRSLISLKTIRSTEKEVLIKACAIGPSLKISEISSAMTAVRTKYAEYRAKVNRFLFGDPSDANMKSIRQGMKKVK